MSAVFPETSLDEGTFYRFFNTVSGDHFFTADYAEAANVVVYAPQYAYEGTGFHAVFRTAGTQDLYRLFNTVTGEHFYTTDATERDALAAGEVWRAEGSAGKIDAAPTAGDVAVHRFYDTASGTHFYTASEEERAAILANPASASYHYEGVIGYAPAGEPAAEEAPHLQPEDPDTPRPINPLTDYAGVLPEYPANAYDMGVDGAGESRINIPAGHSFFTPVSLAGAPFGRGIGCSHSGLLTIDASAGTAVRAAGPVAPWNDLPTIGLYEEAASARSVINGCAGGLRVWLGPGTDEVHFNPAADNWLVTSAPGNEAPYPDRGHDVATGLGIGDHVDYDTWEAHTFGHAADGSLVLPYGDGRGEVTLLGVSSIHVSGEGLYVVDGLVG